ncbi:MAG: hypothetical protein NTU41_14075, partial [Chloroflexi bacterium]|nr:hypothetical protein [Chloroflexota bacterium]
GGGDYLSRRNVLPKRTAMDSRFRQSDTSATARGRPVASPRFGLRGNLVPQAPGGETPVSHPAVVRLLCTDSARWSIMVAHAGAARMAPLETVQIQRQRKSRKCWTGSIAAGFSRGQGVRERSA